MYWETGTGTHVVTATPPRTAHLHKCSVMLVFWASKACDLKPVDTLILFQSKYIDRKVRSRETRAYKKMLYQRFDGSTRQPFYDHQLFLFI